MKTVRLLVLVTLFLVSCRTPAAQTQPAPNEACAVTQPVWDKPPEDSAVQGAPAFGYYFINADRSIWGSASWKEQEEKTLRVNEEGLKMGWFRPEGAELVITGERMDAEAPPLDVYMPCCYPNRFQSSSLFFPTEGCWEITAKAADSVLSFTLWVWP
ncbi:MAG: hypothetical protein CVU39_22440 [Chloroflexi bacterium HGW-Chloroflexi-10]|nr:MAG: hypothetical protein CVU39_22440 [Chloroflexi bacterium HGW-Chloroflexi-10]